MRATRRARRVTGVARLIVLLAATALFFGRFTPELYAAVEMPVGETPAPISIRGEQAARWQQGAYEVWVVRGSVELKQGDVTARSQDAVFWVDRAEPFSGQPSKIIAYFEGGVRVDFGHRGNPHSVSGVPAQTLQDKVWLGRFHTTAGIEMIAPITSGEPEVTPSIFRRGLEARDPAQFVTKPPPTFDALESLGVKPAQFTGEEIAPPVAAPMAAAPASSRRVRFYPRAGSRFQINIVQLPERQEQATIISGGVQILIDGLEQFGTVSVEADRIVVWTSQFDLSNPSGSQITDEQGPIELYMEGNIVFRQGDRVIYAERMFYNVRQEYGVVLKAEMLTPVPEYQGLLRLRADVLQQVNAQQFQAYNAALTSSRIGVPRYWFQSENIQVTDTPRPLLDPFTNQPLIDPATGEQQVEHSLLATSRNNFIYLGGVPVFYWPTIATDLTKPTFYVDSVRFNSDRIFGQQVLVDLDVYQLLGIDRPPANTRWTVSTDYLSQRGVGLGTNYRYAGDIIAGIPGPYKGFFDAWGIKDSGLDTLGADRMNLEPEKSFRGRILAQHRQVIANDWQVTAELGLISDRNFLEQYYESEWDTFKDETTDVELKKYYENSTLNLYAQGRLNDFFTQTEWLPRADHFTLGQSLLFDRLTWHEHSHIGYGNFQVASAPTNPIDAAKFQLLPWERPAQGVRTATRQEIDMPLEAGPVKIVPYAIGEAAFWGSDLNDEQVTRLFGQAGIRASLPVWRVDPTVKSELFNLNGLAHKITYEAEAFYGDADQSLSRFPLYDQLDDDATEHFRRRMLFNTFGLGPGDQIPIMYDERFYALRSNMQGWVTGQSTEIVDDLTEVRLGVKQRWQTKRGLAGHERIIDWITLDVDAVLFPDPNRDNFGEALGMIDYDFRWHLGDRFSILSDGYADVFDQGLRQVTVGALMSRPEHGNLYVGFRSTEGPISSNLLATYVNYRMSEKWIATAGTTIDFASAGNIGQNVSFTRVGESFLLRMGFNYDASRNNYGFQFGIEPRFLPTGQLGVVGGVQIPPAGALGLE